MKLNQTLKDCIFKVKHYSKQIAIYLPLRVSLRNAVEYHRPWVSILRPGPRTGLKSRAEAVRKGQTDGIADGFDRRTA